MHRFPIAWKAILNKLGLPRKHSRARRAIYHRKLRFDQFEDRRMLAVFTVNSNLDNTISDGLTTLREAISVLPQ